MKNHCSLLRFIKRIFSLSLVVVCLLLMFVPAVSAANVPTLTSVKAKSSEAVVIKWKKYSGATGYVIYQKKEDGSYKKIKTIKNVKTTSYTRTDLDSATKYSYKVKAYKTKKVNGKTKTTYTGSSKAKSTYTKLSTPSITYIEGVAATSIKLKWKEIDEADGYIIYKKTKDGYEKIKTIRDSSINTYTVKELVEGKKYGFVIKAYMKTNGETVYSALSSAKYSYPSMPVELHEVYLIDSDLYTYKPGSFTDAFGNTYAGVYYFERLFQSNNGREPHATYNLNADYSEFSGSVVAAPHTNTKKSYYIHIYADDVLVHTVSNYTKTTGRIDFKLDVTNIEKLSICVGQETRGGDTNCDICIVNAQLTK